MEYQITEAIKEAIDKCKWSGTGTVVMNDHLGTIISSEWESSELYDDKDVITIYIHQHDRIVFRYQVLETLTEQ
jgi:hypothetical protein